MSRPLNRRAAAYAFARGENPRTACALTFVGDVAYSYAEPIAVREGGTLYRTTAKFSMTTSHHVGAVGGAWAVENGVETVEDVPHQIIRRMTRDRGQRPGTWGDAYDRVAA